MQKTTYDNYNIRILKDGTWMHQDEPITRHNLARLFASVLKREADGSYWLETPAERGPIIVEDLPFIAVEVKVEGRGTPEQLLSFRTNMDDWALAGPRNPLVFETQADGTVLPSVMIRQGLAARINRATYYEVAGLAVASGEDKEILGVWSNQQFFPIGRRT